MQHISVRKSYLHSKRVLQRLSTLIPLVCASGLLVLVGLMFKVVEASNSNVVYAEDGTMSSYSSSPATSLSLIVNDSLDLSTNAESNKVAYIVKDLV